MLLFFVQLIFQPDGDIPDDATVVIVKLSAAPVVSNATKYEVTLISGSS